MSSVNLGTHSIWQNVVMPHTQPLFENIETDVCIVGAGIVGLTVAYRLASRGKRVVVLDCGSIGGGETGHTTAHLMTALDDRYFNLEKMHGVEGATLAAESQVAAINYLEEIIHLEKIDCNFERVNGYLFSTSSLGQSLLDKECLAAHRVGLNDVKLVSSMPGLIKQTNLALKFPEQGQFHPLKYLSGIASSILNRGGKIFTQSHVVEVKGGSSAYIKVENGSTVKTNAIVVATNSPINDRYTMHTKQAPYRTYAMAFELLEPSLPAALYWDTEDPYHYVRTYQDEHQNNFLIVGGEDHKTAQSNDSTLRFKRLESWTKQYFPNIGTLKYVWSGQVMEPSDGLAYIGKNRFDSDNVFIATGDSGTGITNGPIAALIISNLIDHLSHPWQALYDPSRSALRHASEFIKENINVAIQYADLLTPGEVASIDEIEAGTGAIVREGLHKYAVYKNENGSIIKKHAECPHLGCIVHWNSLEKSWDCPCHGSRFDIEGVVITGPSRKNLAAAS